MEALGFLEYILECFVNIYRYLKILWVFPRDPAMKVQSNPPIPGLKLSNQVDKSHPMLAYVPGVIPR